MNIKVQRQRMVGRLREHRLQDLNHFAGPRLRLAVGQPEVPRPQVHQRFGEQRADISVIGIGFPNQPHRRGVRLVQRLAIVRLRISVPRAERVDQRFFSSAGAARRPACVAQRLPSSRCSFFRDNRVVDVWPVGQGDSPPRHGALRINFGCPAKRTDRLVVVESVQKAEPLVEVTLRFGRGSGYLPSARSQSVKQRHSYRSVLRHRVQSAPIAHQRRANHEQQCPRVLWRSPAVS
jgi:hypothetical protein